MNLRLYIICVAAVLALVVVPAVAADNSTANVYGGVYSSDTFEPLDNAVVDVNSTPSQSMVAKSGIYSFELEPGNYSITAKYYQNNTLNYSATEEITIKKGGSYRLDLLLLPVYSEELMEGSAANLSTDNSTSSAGNPGTVAAVNKTNASNSVNVPAQTGIYSSTVSYLLIALALSLLLAVGYSLSKKYKKIKKNEPKKEKTDHMTGDFAIEETVSVTQPVESESRIPVIEPETEPEPRIPLTKPVADSESKVHAAGQTVGSESKVSEKKVSLERKEENEEEYQVQEAELADLGSEAENKNNSSEEPADDSEIEISAPKKKLPLPADLQEIMDIIRGHGGRITQKDLRNRLKYSEGKVSLMLADLERRDLIEKFKRGRGNVVILKDDAR